MSIIGLLSGNYIDTSKQFIEKIFRHEAKKFHCEPSDLFLIIYRESDGSIELGTYSKTENKTWRMIPDKEVQEILMK
jgi:hypothetical protein